LVVLVLSTYIKNVKVLFKVLFKET